MPPLSAAAQTPVSDDTAARFYENCMKKPEGTMSAGTQDIFCQCTAYHTQKNLTMEDMQAMQDPSPAGRLALNKVLLDVYAPCMEFPVRDLIYNKCMENDFQRKEGICSCLADKMGRYTADSAQARLKDVLAQDPNIYDPMGPIVNSPDFAQREKRLALDCIQGK